MKAYVAFTLFLMLLFSPCLSNALMTEFAPGYQIATLVQNSDLVVIGRVTNTQFVYRDNIAPNFTTDITLAVETLIKGEPNAGENTVKFMIRGGRGVNPNTGRELIVEAQHSPKFKMNERVLVFLKISTRPELDYPYGRYYIYRGIIGKRTIADDKLSMPYTVVVNILNRETGATEAIRVKKFIDLPVELVVDLGKASVKDFEAIRPLEDDIKNVVLATPQGDKPELNKETLNRLKTEAKSVLDEDKDDKLE